MGVQYSEYGKYQHRICMASDLTVSHYAVLSFFFFLEGVSWKNFIIKYWGTSTRPHLPP